MSITTVVVIVSVGYLPLAIMSIEDEVVLCLASLPYLPCSKSKIIIVFKSSFLLPHLYTGENQDHNRFYLLIYIYIYIDIFIESTT
jgi:ABC-type uncharacterized transport system YnjBCD ATPase subunit